MRSQDESLRIFYSRYISCTSDKHLDAWAVFQWVLEQIATDVMA